MSVHNHNNHTIEYDGDIKPFGAFGAPKCKCTSMLIALSVTLIGLVLMGVGGCVAGFQSHEAMAKWTGIVLALFGLILFVGGIVLFILDSVRRGKIQSTATTGHAGEPPTQLVQQSYQPPRSGVAPSTEEAPPSYDAVVKADSSFESQSSNHRRQQTANNMYNQQARPVAAQPRQMNPPRGPSQHNQPRAQTPSQQFNPNAAVQARHPVPNLQQQPQRYTTPNAMVQTRHPPPNTNQPHYQPRAQSAAAQPMTQQYQAQARQPVPTQQQYTSAHAQGPTVSTVQQQYRGPTQLLQHQAPTQLQPTQPAARQTRNHSSTAV